LETRWRSGYYCRGGSRRLPPTVTQLSHW